MDSRFFTASRPVQRRSSPKVVSIPVHFVGSEEPQKPPTVTAPADAARKVQKFVRGFLVRKSFQKIASIRNEVNDIEQRITKAEAVELMLKDSKERLRVNEALMSLLFKLDSIRGVDSGVRDLRKAVIKKAIALQERVDGLVSGDYQTLGHANCNDPVTEIVENSDNCSIMDSDNAQNQVAEHRYLNCGSGEQIDEAAGEAVEDPLADDELMCDSGEKEIPLMEVVSEVKTDEANSIEATNNPGDMEASGTEIASTDEEDCSVKEIDEKCEILKDVSFSTEQSVPTCSIEDRKEGDSSEGKGGKWMEVEKSRDEEIEEKGDDGKRNRKLLEKMMAENEKMMRMMTQIFERNEQQTRMLNSLSHRVEQLEKAFVCDKLRRNKKKKRSNQ